VIPAETILLAGPTGAGKTALSLLLAKRLGGEIVGADAFQIYRGLPILTAQPTPKQRTEVPHHLIGCVDPLESYDAARYRREALEVIQSIVARGKRPIVVGGTGLYLKSLLGGLDELPPRDPGLRAELAALDLPTLVERLCFLDPKGAAAIDQANRRRVERALEIVMLTGRPLDRDAGPVATPPGVHGFLITRSREELTGRIAANVESMFVNRVEAEVAALPEETTGLTASKTLGLVDLRSLLRGEISRTECIERITIATRRYAKRQMTWFRHQHDLMEIDLSSAADPAEAVETILQRIG
jgi:tRNA dimethylallyltransferase